MKQQRHSVLEEQGQSQRELIVPDPFDYTPLPANIAHDMQTAAQRIRRLVKRSLEGVIAIGQELLAVKAALPHGRFLPWLQAEFGWTERTARRFMAVAQGFGTKSDIISDLQLQPTAAYLLTAPSVPYEALAEAIRRAEKGEKITVLAAKQLVSALRQQQPARQKQAFPPVSPPKKILGELLASLESFRQRWEPAQLALLAHELREFADFLEQNNGRA